jgi:hypothetical protein
MQPRPDVHDMTRLCFHVDFNELIEPDLVLLARTDLRLDARGQLVELHEGLRVRVCQADRDREQKSDDLYADGVVEKNSSDASWAASVKWACRIDGLGIRYKSESE